MNYLLFMEVNNMTTQEIKFEYDIPEGYRFVRYGCPKRGESYLSKNDVRIAGYDYDNEWPIIEKMVYCEKPTKTSKQHKNADLIHAWAEGAIIQYKDTSGNWLDCADNEPSWYEELDYRIKPTKKVVRFRNWLTKSGSISTWNLIEGDSVEDYNEFKCWVGDWQSVEVEEQ